MWLVSAAYAFPFVDRGWIAHDDGTLAQSAERVLKGELPHRDYDEAYTGGLTAFHALAFEVLGTSLRSLRYAFLLAFLAFVPLVFAIARRALSPWLAAAVTFTCVAWTVPNYFASMPSWYNLFLAALGAWALLRHIESGRLSWVFLAGIAAGLSVLVKIIGLYDVAAVLLFLAWREQTLQSSSRRGLGGAAKHRVRGAQNGAGRPVRPSPRARLPNAKRGRGPAPLRRSGRGARRASRRSRVAGWPGPFRPAHGGTRAARPSLRGRSRDSDRSVRRAVRRRRLPASALGGRFRAASAADRHGFLWLPGRVDASRPSRSRPCSRSRASRPAGPARSRCGRRSSPPRGAARARADARRIPLDLELRAVSRRGRGAHRLLVAVARRSSLGARRRQQIFLLLALAACIGLVQYPFSSPIYFCYAVPFTVLAIAFLVTSEGAHVRWVHASVLAFYLGSPFSG